MYVCVARGSLFNDALPVVVIWGLQVFANNIAK